MVIRVLGTIFALFVAFVVVMRVLRRQRKQLDIQPQWDFTIDELLAMQRSGQITPEEFERARQVVLSRKQATEDAARSVGFPVLPPVRTDEPTDS